MEESKMDLNDFTSAENKKMTTENDIPTFNPPIGDAPKVGVDGKSKKAQTFTPLRHPTWIRDATTTRKRGW